MSAAIPFSLMNDNELLITDVILFLIKLFHFTHIHTYIHIHTHTYIKGIFILRF